MDSRIKQGILYGITCIVAICSILYELLLAQTASFFLSNYVFWYSMTIGCYLGSMGTGVFLCQRVYGRKSAAMAFLDVELLLSVVGGMSVFLLQLTYVFVRLVWLRYEMMNLLWIFITLFFFFIFVIGVLTGFEIPLLIRLGKERLGKDGLANRVLGADYFGSLVGGLLFSLVLIPRYDFTVIAFFTAFLNILTAAFILGVYTSLKMFPLRKVLSMFLVTVILVAGISQGDALEQYFLQKLYYDQEYREGFWQAMLPDDYLPRVERIHSPYQKIDIVQYPLMQGPFSAVEEGYTSKYKKDPDFPKGYALFLDGYFQFYVNNEEVYHEYFAHIPISLNGEIPREVLILGGGDGLLLREILKYPQVRNVVLVELDEKMLALARSHPVLSYVNKKSFSDPRVSVVVGDAYHYVKEHQETYDAIYMDFPIHKDYNISKLYSQEFYAFVKKRLNPDGFAVFDAPGAGVSKEDLSQNGQFNFCSLWEKYYNTLKASGFQTVVSYATHLERNNPEARERVKEALGDIAGLKLVEGFAGGTKRIRTYEGTQEMVHMVVSQYADDFRESFIVAKPQGAFQEEYRINEIELHVLNQQRFDMAFDAVCQEPSINPQKVNSIMRPTLVGRYSNGRGP